MCWAVVSVLGSKYALLPQAEDAGRLVSCVCVCGALLVCLGLGAETTMRGVDGVAHAVKEMVCMWVRRRGCVGVF